MKDIGYPEIPVNIGSEGSYKSNDAANFLVRMANKYPGELSILGLGSLTNLYHAWKIDKDFYKKINTISLMGGITEPLVINKRLLKELNFTCNYKAALNVLKHGKEIIIATGNTCLDGFFTYNRFEKLKEGNKFEKWLYENSIYWFNKEQKIFNNDGIYIWDVLPAAAMLNPELFTENIVKISPDNKSMKKGKLLGKGEVREVIIPKIKNIEEYIEHVYEQLKIFGEGF